MKKFAILILCGLIALTGCYQITDVGETYAVESEVSEIVSIENDEAYVLENEISDAISTEIDETSYSYTDIIAIADETIECLDDLCGIQVWSWDLIFIPDGKERTMGTYPDEERFLLWNTDAYYDLTKYLENKEQ